MEGPSLSIGIEEEYQTVDPVTRDLKSHIHAEIVQKGRLLMAERVKPEMHQSVVEIGTSVAAPTAAQIFAELGADVFKVENPAGGDDARSWGPPFVDGVAAMFVLFRQRWWLVDDNDPRKVLAREIGNTLRGAMERLGHSRTERVR